MTKSSETNRLISLALAGLFTANVLLWTFSVYHHHFRFSPADVVAILCMVSAAALASKNRLRHQPALRGDIMLYVLCASLWLLVPVVRLALLHTDFAWTILYVIPLALGLCLPLLVRLPKNKLLPCLLSFGVWAVPYGFPQDQQYYFDRLQRTIETRRGVVHEVQWKQEKWIHFNRKLSSATVDRHLYYEPLIHPILHLAEGKKKILLIGGDNGGSWHELKKYERKELSIVPYDIEFFGAYHQDLKAAKVIEEEPFAFLTRDSTTYDVIITDLPDPTTIELNQYYTLEFFRLCYNRLSESGLMVTQAGSPYTRAEVHYSILQTMASAGFHVINFHNQVPTLGQWAWVLGSKSMSSEVMKKKLREVNMLVETLWWNAEAMAMMLSFGKKEFFLKNKVEVNRIQNPYLISITKNDP